MSPRLKILSPKVKNLSPRLKILSPEVKNLSPRVKILSPRVKIVSHRVKILSPMVKIVSPRVKILSPRVKIVSPRVKILSPRVKILSLCSKSLSPLRYAGQRSSSRHVRFITGEAEPSAQNIWRSCCRQIFRSVNNTEWKLYASVGILFEQNESHVTLECSCTWITTISVII